LNDVHQTCFQGCLVFGESVLLPGVVVNVEVEVVAYHAAFEEPNASLVVGLSVKFDRTREFDELSEFRWVSAT